MKEFTSRLSILNSKYVFIHNIKSRVSVPEAIVHVSIDKVRKMNEKSFILRTTMSYIVKMKKLKWQIYYVVHKHGHIECILS